MRKCRLLFHNNIKSKFTLTNLHITYTITDFERASGFTVMLFSTVGGLEASDILDILEPSIEEVFIYEVVVS